MWRKRLRRWKRWRQQHWNERHGHRRALEQEEDRDTYQDEQEDDRESEHDQARVIATVLAGFEEISGAEIESEVFYQMVMTQLGRVGSVERSPGAWQEWRNCARVLADARTNEISRTLLAIFIYVFGVASALYEVVGGGNTSKPGGRIGSAVFLMWLAPLSLLANTVGTFTSRRTCLTIMRLFTERCRAALAREKEEEQPQPSPQQGYNHARPAPAHHRSPSIVISPSERDEPSLSLPSPAIEAGSSTFVPAIDRSRARAQSTSNTHDYLSHSMQAQRTRPPADSIALGPVPGQRTLQSDPPFLPDIPRTAPLRLDDAVEETASIVIDNRRPSEVDPLDQRGRGSSTPQGMGRGSEEPLLSRGQPEFRTTMFTEREKVPLVSQMPWHVYFHWMQPLGAIYTYRPWKVYYRSISIKTHAQFASNWFLFSLAVFPVAVSVVGAFIIIWYAVPVGWSCRHVWVVGVAVCWLLSVACTTWMHHAKPFGLSNRTLWVLVTIKDGIVGIASLALVFLSTTGLFNSCYCWASYMWHNVRHTQPHVPLEASDTYDHHAVWIYGPIVFGCLLLQLIFFVVVLAIWWDGVYVVRWNEEQCCREWRYEVSNGGININYNDDDLYLLFWCWKDELEEEENKVQVRRRTFEQERRMSRSRSQTPALRARSVL
ncbi:hypothetical protein B0I35DRAFT_410904 [Stachybotrys elegans]|uniref:Transmembrane protein n=1 Tax=Stachybotrys elegans TaxID=80388 RepID=A0A8K0WPN1_9HYPO|nr:hypothetical protein B0I35DRAFT_410904 [Stachybotrys elegans]